MTRKRESVKRYLLWAYCRVSTSKVEQELSLDEQIAWAKDHARLERSRLVVFSERASAKTIVNRPECVLMLSKLAECEPSDRPDAVIATSFDRLSRDITDTLILARSLRDAGVELYVRDRGNVQMNSFADQASLVGQAMGGHAENEARSNRAKASWERRRREGKPTSNKAPYGIQLRDERDTPADDSAIWVRRAFEWYAAGIGMPTIAQRMKANAPAHRVKTSKVASNGEIIVRERQPVWEPNRVRKLFAQNRYRGVVVPEEIFDAVQERLRAVPRRSQKRKNEYPLSGAIKCGTCGRSFHGHCTGGGGKRNADGTMRYYPNAKKVRAYTCTVCRYRINAEKLEGWFREALDRLIASPAALRSWVAKPIAGTIATLKADESRLERALVSVGRKRQRAWDLALSGSPAIVKDLPEQLVRIDLEEASLRDQLGEVKAALSGRKENDRTFEAARELLRDFWHLYERGSYEQRRELCIEVVATLGGAVATKAGIEWTSAAHALV